MADGLITLYVDFNAKDYIEHMTLNARHSKSSSMMPCGVPGDEPDFRTTHEETVSVFFFFFENESFPDKIVTIHVLGIFQFLSNKILPT